MRQQIKESDWKIFRELQPLALQRFCERILQEIDQIQAETDKSFHQRYLDIYRLIERRDKEIARAFDTFSRSTAEHKIALMRSLDLWSDEEFSRFSEETRNLVEIMLGKQKGSSSGRRVCAVPCRLSQSPSFHRPEHGEMRSGRYVGGSRASS